MNDYIQIPEWNNYFINKEGNIIRKWKNGNITHLKKSLNNQGYITFALTNKGKSKTYSLHRILGEIFINNDDNLPCIDHINRNRTDNRLENLRWVNYTQNNINRERKAYILESNDKRTLKNGEIVEYKYFRLWWWVKEGEFKFKRRSKRFKFREDAEDYKKRFKL